MRHQVELIENYPARIAQQLLQNQADLALIPVAAIPKLPEAFIVSNYCIGCDGAVASVCIFSEVPMEKIERVYLDYQSRTSVNLARILLKEYWKKEVEFIDAKGEEFRHEITGATAGVVIGDRALEQRHLSTYHYDLGEAWKQHTGLPFVFAAWVANKKLPDDFLHQFNEANAQGLQHIEEVIQENPQTLFDLEHYYRNCISYELTEDKMKGLKLFLEKLKAFQMERPVK